MEKLIPISMDGPNFNCDVLRKHSQNQKEREMSSVIELGSCELDIVHDTLLSGITHFCWNLHKALHIMWKIFDELSARRDIYIRETCDVFPHHFFPT